MIITFPDVLSIVSLIVSIYVLYITKLKKAKLHIPKIKRIGIHAVIDKKVSHSIDSPAFILPIVFENIGSKYISIYDLFLKVRYKGSEYIFPASSEVESFGHDENLVSNVPPNFLSYFHEFSIKGDESKLLFIKFSDPYTSLPIDEYDNVLEIELHVETSNSKKFETYFKIVFTSEQVKNLYFRYFIFKCE